MVVVVDWLFIIKYAPPINNNKIINKTPLFIFII
jgi:hypothetical protein